MHKYHVFVEGSSIEPDVVEADGHFSTMDRFISFYKTVPDPGYSGRYVPRKFWFGDRWEKFFNPDKTKSDVFLVYKYSTVLKIERVV